MLKTTFFLQRPSCHFSTRGNVSREMFTVSGPTFFILLLDKNMTVKPVKIVKQQTFLSMTHKRKKLQVLEPQKRDISEYFSTLSTSAEKPWRRTYYTRCLQISGIVQSIGKLRKFSTIQLCPLVSR